MNWWKRILAGALVVLWVPMTMHCSLESSLPGMEFLACCPDEEGAPHQDSDCEDDACAVVESGSYKTENNRVAVPTPTLVPALFLTPLPSLDAIPAVDLVAFDASPPELRTTWQFSFRAALRPRAPSFVS